MSDAQLFAVTESGPQPLPVPDGASDFTHLYDGLTLGVYSVLRTFAHNKFLDLAGHLARTVQSMRALGWEDALDEVALRRALHRVCTAFPAPEMRVRIDVLAEPAHQFGTDSRVLIALLPFTPPPPHLYESGVAVAIAPGVARHRPDVKTADFATVRQQLQQRSDVYEYLMVNQRGQILEGVSTNFYGVYDGVLHTAGAGVLAGITRRIILEQAAECGIPVRLEPAMVADIAKLDEAAISSSSRGLLPVVRIEAQKIGSGQVGPLVQTLMTAYNVYVQRSVRPAVATD